MRKNIGQGQKTPDRGLLRLLYTQRANKYLLALVEDAIDVIHSKTEGNKQEFESFLANMRCIVSDGMQVAKNRVALVRYICETLQKYNGKVCLGYPYTKMLPLDSVQKVPSRIRIPSQRHHVERTQIGLGNEI